MSEQWMPFPAWEQLYEISDMGHVRSISRPCRTTFGVRMHEGQLVKPITRKNGYLVVNLTDKKRRGQILVHRAVLKAFVGFPVSGQQACHNNGIRSDNRLCNLRWDSVKANHADKKRHGTHQCGMRSGAAKLTDSLVRYIRSARKTIRELVMELGLSRGCIEKAKYRQTWKHIE